MFQFPPYALLERSIPNTEVSGMGCPIRKSTDHCSYAAPRSLSQLYTSFIASVCLGIHRVPLVCFYYMVCTASPPTNLLVFMLLVYCGPDGDEPVRLPWRSTQSLKSKNYALLSFAAHTKCATSDLLLLLYCFIMSKNPRAARCVFYYGCMRPAPKDQ